MNKEIKKTAVDLTDLALGLIILGVVVSIGAVTLITYRDAKLTDLPTTTVANESVAIDTTGDTLANVWVKSVTACINNTSGEVIPTANYTATISPLDGTATLANTTTTHLYTDANCTYDYYDVTQQDYALADDAAVGVGEFGNWFKIIAIVGIAAVVLSLIFMAFGRRGGGSNY